jgi:hypothetical protein
MSLTGNLLTMSLPDILQWASTGKKTGTLHLQRASVQKRIAFRDGNIVSTWSNDPREYLGQFLVRDRLISEEQLFRTLLTQEKERRALGSILVEAKIISEEDLKRVLQAKGEETVYDLFLWPEGRFEFKDDELPEGILVMMQVTAVVMEGIRRVDEWERIRKQFPSMNTTFKVVGTPQIDDPAQRQALGLAAAGKTLAQISLEMHSSEFAAASLLFDLRVKDAVAVDQVGEELRSDPVGAIRDLLATAVQRFAEKRFDAALQAYEQVLALDRLNQNAKKGLVAVMEARGRERSLKTIALDKVPILAVDFVTLTREKFDPQEGFVLSRVNGQWDVRSILKLCPMAEEEALLIFARLLERSVITLQ